MSFSRIARRALRPWHSLLYRRKQAKIYARLRKQSPELRKFDEAAAQARRGHRPSKPIEQARKDYMTSLLKGEA